MNTFQRTITAVPVQGHTTAACRAVANGETGKAFTFSGIEVKVAGVLFSLRVADDDDRMKRRRGMKGRGNRWECIPICEAGAEIGYIRPASRCCHDWWAGRLCRDVISCQNPQLGMERGLSAVPKPKDDEGVMERYTTRSFPAG